MENIVIIGGGVSGLASALDLSEKGFKIKLHEAKPFLGGRTYSFIDRQSGFEVDNGQHILMGCYPYTFDYLKRIGSYNLLKFQNNFHAKFINSDGIISILDCPDTFAPTHILSALNKFNMIDKKDRLNLLNLAFRIYFSKLLLGYDERTVQEFLSKAHQSDKMINSLWQPIIISALNGKADQISADIFKKTIYEMFFRSRKNSRIVLPQVGLSDLLINPAIKAIEKNGGNIFSNSRITNFKTEGDRIIAATLSNGQEIKGDIFISAIPFNQINKFKIFNNLYKYPVPNTFTFSPIISIYLWFEERLFDDDFIFLLDRNTQVIFNRTNFITSDNAKNCLCIVISAANHLINCSKEHILSLVIKEISNIFGTNLRTRLKNSKIIKERTATLLITPGTGKIRPEQTTYFKNLHIAGDWVNTKLPATIESAIKSGYNIYNILQ